VAKFPPVPVVEREDVEATGIDLSVQGPSRFVTKTLPIVRIVD